MKNYGFAYRKRKFFVFIFLACILVLIWVLFNKPAAATRDTQVSRVEADLKNPVSFKADMPDVSSYGYLVSEFKLLNALVSKGLIVYEYRNDFLNRSRDDYDIEARYADFSLDFEQFKREIKRTISGIQELRPVDDQGQIKQQETLDKLMRLDAVVGQYKSHLRTPKETAKYLKDCAYALRRVEDQLQAP